MKKYYLIVLCALALSGLAATIEWYSQQPAAASLEDADLMVVEKSAPHAYRSFTLAALKSYLNDTGPNIVTFVSDSPTNEIGSSLATVDLTWTLSGSTPTSQSINQGIGAIPIGTHTTTYTGPVTTTTSFTLSVSNTKGSDTATATVRFLYKAYWGASDQTSLNDAQIIALSSEFGSSRARTKTVTCAAQYMYFCYPAAWGTATFTVNGLLNTAWQLTTRDFVNASGATVSMNIYRSDNLLTGTYIVAIQ